MLRPEAYSALKTHLTTNQQPWQGNLVMTRQRTAGLSAWSGPTLFRGLKSVDICTAKPLNFLLLGSAAKSVEEFRVALCDTLSLHRSPSISARRLTLDKLTQPGQCLRQHGQWLTPSTSCVIPSVGPMLVPTCGPNSPCARYAARRQRLSSATRPRSHAAISRLTRDTDSPSPRAISVIDRPSTR